MYTNKWSFNEIYEHENRPTFITACGIVDPIIFLINMRFSNIIQLKYIKFIFTGSTRHPNLLQKHCSSYWLHKIFLCEIFKLGCLGLLYLNELHCGNLH